MWRALISLVQLCLRWWPALKVQRDMAEFWQPGRSAWGFSFLWCIQSLFHHFSILDCWNSVWHFMVNLGNQWAAQPLWQLCCFVKNHALPLGFTMRTSLGKPSKLHSFHSSMLCGFPALFRSINVTSLGYSLALYKLTVCEILVLSLFLFLTSSFEC